MNVREIMTELEAELLFAPDLVKHRRDMRRVINRAYQEICGEERWDFLYKEVPLTLIPDAVVARADWTVAATASGDSREFVCQISAFSGVWWGASEQDPEHRIYPLLEGAEIGPDDQAVIEASVTTSNLAWGPFVVERVQSFAYTSKNNDLTLWADPRLRGLNLGGLGADEGALRIRKRRYRLPVDCDQLVSMAYADTPYEPLTPWPRKRAQTRGLEDQTSKPRIYFPSSGFRDAMTEIPPDPANHTGTSSVSTWVHHTRNLPHSADYTVSTVAAGNLKANTTYRVFVAWSHSGRLSPASRIKEVTTTAVNLTVRLSDLGTTLDAVDYESLGRYLYVFMAEDESAFYFAGSIEPAHPPVTQIDITRFRPGGVDTAGGFLASPHDGRWRWDEMYPGGEYQYIQFWPHPDAVYRLRMTYLKRPAQLLEDSDEPEFESRLHKAVLHRAVMELGARHEGVELKRTHAQLYEQVMRQVRKRHLQAVEMTPAKGLIGRTRRQIPTLGDITWDP